MQQIEYHLVEMMSYTYAELVRDSGLGTEEEARPQHWRNDDLLVRSAERIRARLRMYLTNLSAAYSPRAVQMMEQQTAHLAETLAGVQQNLPFSPPGAGRPPRLDPSQWAE
ncbi:TPA_asm: hypothetical protein [Microviridae sp.]|nr:TPA_asm: hypothetical protein [Microviridae sp.]